LAAVACPLSNDVRLEPTDPMPYIRRNAECPGDYNQIMIINVRLGSNSTGTAVAAAALLVRILTFCFSKNFVKKKKLSLEARK
jgi:hypothetical protein